MEVVELGQDFMDGFYKDHPEFKDTKETWCECEHESDPLFHEDSVMPLDSCVFKHHYHCGWCLGLIQIG